MSEYQYYEFQTVDRPLTPGEMSELRALSTRSTITPTRFQNVYHWGDFQGEPLELMERYFDAFVYVANWGTHRFMMRLPRRLLDPQTALAYAVADSLEVHVRGDSVILELSSHDDEGMDWITDEEAASWLPALLHLRDELASGDRRSLYLGWLSALEAGEFDGEPYELDDETDDLGATTLEPPVPPGLGHLSASLATLAEFLRVDDNLIAVAAERSPDLPVEPSPDDLQRWIASLPAAEKDVLLLQLASDTAPARAELLQRFHQAHVPRAEARGGERTVAWLRMAAAERGEVILRQEAER